MGIVPFDLEKGTGRRPIMDVLYIALAVVFFGVTGALINFLGKL
jgi:hypothetical protein